VPVNAEFSLRHIPGGDYIAPGHVHKAQGIARSYPFPHLLQHRKAMSVRMKACGISEMDKERGGMNNACGGMDDMRGGMNNACGGMDNTRGGMDDMRGGMCDLRL
jgi:hypothetical protein